MVPVGNIWAAPIPSATPRPITARADSIRAAAIVSAVASTTHSATPAVDPLAASNAHPPYPRIRRHDIRAEGHAAGQPPRSRPATRCVIAVHAAPDGGAV